MEEESGPVVVVGGGLAAVRFVQALRRLGGIAPITMISEEQQPYDRPPLSKKLLTCQDDDFEPVALLTEGALAELDIQLLRGTQAVSLDVERRTLSLDNGTAVTYRTLVVATGARARSFGSSFPHTKILTLRTWSDCVGLRDALQDADHVTVIGGGVLGLEIASSARALDLEVSLIESLPQPMARVVGAAAGSAVADLHRSGGVLVHTNTSIRSMIKEDSGRTRVTLTDGTSWLSDVIVASIGSTPNVEWLQGSGVTLDNGVVCDAFGQSSIPGVYAIGDVARFGADLDPSLPRLEHWTSAGDTANLVAANILSAPGESSALSELAYFWSDQHGVKIQSLGSPSALDDFRVVAGDLTEAKFLGIYSRAGAVTGAVSFAMPGELMRCRAMIQHAAPLQDLLTSTPWVRRPATAVR